jgi:hypothetical protein
MWSVSESGHVRPKADGRLSRESRRLRVGSITIGTGTLSDPLKGCHSMIQITLQYFDGCPNWKVLDATLATAIAGLDIEATVDYHLIDTPQAAEEFGFRGSPTVLLDGVDPFADRDAPFGLTCRIYRTEKGLAGTPSAEQVHSALVAHLRGS